MEVEVLQESIAGVTPVIEPQKKSLKVSLPGTFAAGKCWRKTPVDVGAQLIINLLMLHILQDGCRMTAGWPGIVGGWQDVLRSLPFPAIEAEAEALAAAQLWLWLWLLLLVYFGLCISAAFYAYHSWGDFRQELGGSSPAAPAASTHFIFIFAPAAAGNLSKNHA